MWGRGISKILSLEPETEFKEVGTHFITVFRRKDRERDSDKQSPQKTPQKTPQKMATPLEKKVIGEIMKNPLISRQQIARNLNISQETVKEYLEKLKLKGLLKRIGPDKGGYWEVVR